MNIFFTLLAPPFLQGDMCSDYQLDMLFHGLIKNGHTVYTLHDHWWMLESEKAKRPDEFKKIWGKGFTIYGTIAPHEAGNIKTVGIGPVDGTDIDLCIVGVHHTSAGNDEILANALGIIHSRMGIPKEKTVIVDGWDRPYINRSIARDYRYFKRELYDEYRDCAIPISFAIPEEKIRGNKTDQDSVNFKKYDVAPLIPVNQTIDPSYMQTYQYNDEKSYYDMYQDSAFGLTSKKGGWDTLRHYEMVANGCIPIFVDIERCPSKTLHLWPKDLLSAIKHKDWVKLNFRDGTSLYPRVLDNCSCVSMTNPGKVNTPRPVCYAVEMWDDINDVSDYLIEWLRTQGTTKYLADYVIRCST